MLRSLFGIDERFDDVTENALNDFYDKRDCVLGGDLALYGELRRAADSLAARSTEVRNIVLPELYQVARKLGREP